MMVKRSATVALAFAAALSPGSAFAAPQSTATANATVEIVAREISIQPNYQLSFGLVKSNNSTAGTVVVAPKGTRSPFGGATTVGSGPCQTEWCEDPTNPSNPDSASYWGPGLYTVTGTPGTTYRVVATATSAQAYWRTPATGREPALMATNFTVATQSSGFTSDTGTIGPGGTDTVRVGGTLQVLGGMKTASYRVLVPLSIQYN